MTTFEHALVGIDGALALGLHRRYGWQIVALAGAVAVSPDWDVLPIAFSTQMFVDAHRVWGHNFLVTMSVAVLIAIIDYRFDVATRVARLFRRGSESSDENPKLSLAPRQQRTMRGFAVWIAVAVAAAMSHLVADLIVSGTRSLPDWELQLLWPFSKRGWVFPMLRWGDPGVTLLFVAGMFAMLRWPQRTQGLAQLTMLLVIGYILVRGWLRHAGIA